LFTYPDRVSRRGAGGGPLGLRSLSWWITLRVELRELGQGWPTWNQRQQTTAGPSTAPFAKCANGSLRMTLFGLGWVEDKQRQQQIPPLRCGMTNKETGNNDPAASRSRRSLGSSRRCGR